MTFLLFVKLEKTDIVQTKSKRGYLVNPCFFPLQLLLPHSLLAFKLQLHPLLEYSAQVHLSHEVD